MALKLRTEKEEVRVDYWEGAEDGEPKGGKETLASFYGCPMTPSEMNRLLEDCSYKEWDSPNKKQAKTRFDKWDDIRFIHERLKKELERWDGVVDTSGNALECNEENKIKTWELNPDIIGWVLEEFKQAGKRIQEEKEAERKNLKALRGGKAKPEPPATAAG